MRMDNETYRIRVEDLLRKLVNEDGQWNEDVRRRLEELALQPRKVRYFLRALKDSPPEVHVYFYRLVMERVKTKDAVADLERHIRQRFYEAREDIKSIISALRDPASILAVFRVIAHTEEGWLAGELIRLMLSHTPHDLEAPIRDAIASGDYLLQCLGIYLVGKSRDDLLLRVLTDFYRKPFGEKLDRLERKSLDALEEGIPYCSEDLILEWLRDGSSRIRLLGIKAAQMRQLEAAVGDLVRLLLVDAKTRAQAAAALLELEAADKASFNPGAQGAQGAAAIVGQAKPGPLAAIVKELLRDDHEQVREAAAKLCRLLAEYQDLLPELARLATEERIPSVQLAALETLAHLDKDRFIAASVEVLTSPQSGGRQAEVVEATQRLLEQHLTASEQERLSEEVAAKREKQEAALEKFAGTVEWWRHDS